jgi:L-amino acid N-acyltransferase YncA
VPALHLRRPDGGTGSTGGGAGREAAGVSDVVSDVTVRPVTDVDWPRIWPFFDAIVQAGETYAYPLDLTVESARSWWIEQPPSSTLVAVDADGTVLGSAKWGPNRPGRGAHVSTASFMVDPAARGRGVGRVLARHVVAAARAAGYHGMQFNAVVETNTAAVALWISLGFEVIGTVPEAFDSRTQGLVGLHVMYLPLQGRPLTVNEG